MSDEKVKCFHHAQQSPVYVSQHWQWSCWQGLDTRLPGPVPELIRQIPCLYGPPRWLWLKMLFSNYRLIFPFQLSNRTILTWQRTGISFSSTEPLWPWKNKCNQPVLALSRVTAFRTGLYLVVQSKIRNRMNWPMGQIQIRLFLLEHPGRIWYIFLGTLLYSTFICPC